MVNYIEVMMIEIVVVKNIFMVYIFCIVIVNDKNFIFVNIVCRFGIMVRQLYFDCRCYQSDEGLSVEDDGVLFSGILIRLF